MVSPVPPGPGWNKQRTEIPRPSSPAGTAAAECPEGAEPPAWEAPAAQISQRAPSPQGRGRLTMRPCAAKQRRRQPGNGEGRRGGLGLGHRISAAGQHRKASYCLRGLRLGHGQDSELRQIHNRDSDSDSLDLRGGYTTSRSRTSKLLGHHESP